MRPTSASAHLSEFWFAVQWPRPFLARLLCVVCLVALSAGSAVGQPSLAGKRVVVIKDKAPLAILHPPSLVAMASPCSVVPLAGTLADTAR